MCLLEMINNCNFTVFDGENVHSDGEEDLSLRWDAESRTRGG